MRTPTLCRTMQAFGYKEVTEDTMASWARKLLMGATLMVGAVFCLTAALPALAAGNTLESVSFASLTGEQIQLSLRFRSTPSKPSTFSIDNPARIALDFPDTTAQVNERSRDINIGVARSVHTVTANDRTRVVIELAKLVNYRTEVVGNEVLVTLGGGANIATAATQPTPYAASSLIQPVAGNGITNVDFRRGESGAGRILIGLTQPDIPIDLRVQAGEILIDFADTALPDELRRRLDVVDFATPVQSIDAFQSGNNVRMVIDAAPKSEHMAYQSGNLYTVEVQPIVEDEQGVRGSDEYTGERLSLNFQDIEIRSVLQLIADFTGLNIVVSDGVAGNLTLRLKNVPWDQALDIILKTKGLDVRRTGNVMLVAPAEEIAAREKLEL